MTMIEDSTEVKKILKDFSATDPKVVIEAIKKNRQVGNGKTFKALLGVLKNTDEPLVETEIIQFLFDLKDEDSVPVLIKAIQDAEMSYYHSFLVSSFWQSAIDGSDYLNVFIEVAIKGEYMTALEALTVVENFDAAFSQSDLQEYEADIIEAIEQEQNEDKKALLVSLGDVIRNLPIEGE